MMPYDTDRLGTRDLASTADPAGGPAIAQDRGERRSTAEPSDPAAAPRDDMSHASPAPGSGSGQAATEVSASDADVSDAPTGATTSSEGLLLASDVSARLRQHWEGVQTRFVDAPRDAVEEADELVASVMRLLADGFAEERERLEAQWDRGGDASTEDLRVALQRYRSFFQRLLST